MPPKQKPAAPVDLAVIGKRVFPQQPVQPRATTARRSPTKRRSPTRRFPPLPQKHVPDRGLAVFGNKMGRTASPRKSTTLRTGYPMQLFTPRYPDASKRSTQIRFLPSIRMPQTPNTPQSRHDYFRRMMSEDNLPGTPIPTARRKAIESTLPPSRWPSLRKTTTRR